MFQSTPPQGGRRHDAAEGLQALRVSIHAPAGGATKKAREYADIPQEFQSTPPQGGRLSCISNCREISSFNPRPRRGGDSRAAERSQARRVSIHAPAGGATFTKRRGPTVLRVSIHAPAGGATSAKCNYGALIWVSIHAPAGGATLVLYLLYDFNMFQSTPPQGGRLGTGSASNCGISFQSTPPQGGRLPVYCWRVPSAMFQSTPPQGGRHSRTATAGWGSCFNPRPRRGGDCQFVFY